MTPDGDWLLSFRLTSTVAIVDPNTGEFKWKWGPGMLSHQHAATWQDNGNILIFDNGCHRLRGPGFSKVVYVSPFVLEGRLGPTPAVFRAHRYALDDSRFEGKELDPAPWADLTQRIAARDIATGEE